MCIGCQLIHKNRLKSQLEKTWEGYKFFFIEPDGRVKRPLNQADTVSEAQAYAMLRAVWMDDKETFDLVYRWTEENLSRKERFGDSLLAWHWGRREDGSFGVLDWETASDADQDYALALIFASRRWGLPHYLTKAKEVLDDIIDIETEIGPDRLRYLVPGSWATKEERFILNPSYFSPASYKIFYKISGNPNWLELVESSYNLLFRISRKLGEEDGVGLIPDWCEIVEGGKVIEAKGFSPHYTWDAIRVPLRLYLDYHWFSEERAKEYLALHLYPFLLKEMNKRGKILAEYSYTGEPLVKYESLTSYALNLFSFEVANSPLKDVLFERLMKGYREENGVAFFGNKEDYFLNSLAWYPLALKVDHLVNLW